MATSNKYYTVGESKETTKDKSQKCAICRHAIVAGEYITSVKLMAEYVELTKSGQPPTVCVHTECLDTAEHNFRFCIEQLAVEMYRSRLQCATMYTSTLVRMASATCIAVLNKDINQNSLQKLLWQPNTIVADLKDGSQLRYSRDVNNLESIPAPNGENKAGEIYENVLVESAKIYRDIEELFGETSIYPWWHRVVKSGNQGYTWSIAPQGGVIYNSRDDEDEHSSKEETRENKAVMAGKFETVYHLPKQIEKVMHHVVILNPTCKEILMLELEDDKITIPKKVLLETTREDLLAGPYMELINGEIYIPVKDKWQSGWLKTQKLLTITDLKGWDETLHVCKAEKTSIMAWKDIKRRWWKIEEVLELGDTPSNEVGLGIDFAIGQALVYLKKAEKQNK